MVEILKFFTNLVNDYHDKIVELVNMLGFSMTDKQLHFILIGILGMIIFACTQILFKILAKFSIGSISFVYTFSVLLVIVFAIEIQQKITHRGVMEFADAVYGIYGFLCLFGGWFAIKWTYILTKKTIEFLKKINF